MRFRETFIAYALQVKPGPSNTEMKETGLMVAGLRILQTWHYSPAILFSEFSTFRRLVI